jgi:MoaA/NifB/PqqE/SkfB family radical SAM enzyme
LAQLFENACWEDKMTQLFRFEPFLGAYLFSMDGEFYVVDGPQMELDDDCHVVTNSDHPKNALSVPAKVQLQFTNRCNLRCPHCYVSSGKPLADEMSIDQVALLLERLRGWGVLQVEWSGGEVFVRKEFLDVLKYAHELGFEQNILTNGIAIGRSKKMDLLERVWEACYSIQVSVDGFGENFDRWVGKPRMWESVLTCLDRLMDSIPEHGRISVATTLDPSNVDDLLDIADAISGRTHFWRLAKQVKHGRSVLEEEPSTTSLFKAWELMPELRAVYPNMSIIHPFDKEDDHSGIWPVDWYSDTGARWFMYVAANGDSYVFPYFDGMEAFYGGNVLKNSFDEIWRSVAFERYRNITRADTGCGSCAKICRMWSRFFNGLENGFVSNGRPISHPGCVLNAA